MFSLIFGMFMLGVAVVFREYANQDEEEGDLQGAQMDGIVALAAVLVAMVLIVTGLVGA